MILGAPRVSLSVPASALSCTRVHSQLPPLPLPPHKLTGTTDNAYPDDWRADLGAMLARHGEAGLITDGLDYTITKH